MSRLLPGQPLQQAATGLTQTATHDAFQERAGHCFHYSNQSSSPARDVKGICHSASVQGPNDDVHFATVSSLAARWPAGLVYVSRKKTSGVRAEAAARGRSYPVHANLRLETSLARRQQRQDHRPGRRSCDRRAYCGLRSGCRGTSYARTG